MSIYPSLKLADKYPELKDSGFTFGEWIENIAKISKRNYDPKKPIKMYVNALFSINKKYIQRYPLSVYKELIRYVDDHVNPEAGHYFERTWHWLFVDEL